MNIAFVIGNSDYDNLSKLEACKNDIKAIGDVLRATGKYGKIFIEENRTSAEIKKSIASKIDFLRKEKTTIEELVFYYTGHGCHKNDQFYYLPTDYDLKRHNSTSLSNDEVDEMLKSLNPELTVKLIDACESGQNYIKSSSDKKDTFLNASKSRFNNCYFMYSSNKNQDSSASDDFGFFTFSLLRSLKNCPENEIRYKDIIDFITDDFEDNDEQKPYFVTQADYTDYFCKDLKSTKDILESYNLEFVDNVEVEKQEVGAASKGLIDFIREDSEEYIDKETAINNLKRLKDAVKGLIINQKLERIFDLSVSEISKISDTDGIENILDDVKNYKYEMFINLKYSYEEYETEVQVPKAINPLFVRALNPFFQEYETKTVTRKRKVLSGFEHSFNTPFSGLSITLNPKFPNIRKQKLNLIFIFNKKDFVIYSNNEEYYEKEWNVWEPYSINKWNKVEIPFNEFEAIEDSVLEDVGFFQNDVLAQLEKKFLK